MPTPSPSPLEHPVWSIGRAYYAYVGLLEVVLVEKGLDRQVRPGMGPVLFALFEADGLSMKEIAARVQLSGSTLTGLLTRMQDEGLVERGRDDKDGRIVRVRLTPLGRSLEPACHAALAAIGTALSQGITHEELQQLRPLLERLTAALRKAETQRREPK